MAVVSPRRSRVRVRSAAPASSSGLRVSSYVRLRAFLGLGLFVVFFGWLWLVNGAFSAELAAAQLSVSLLLGVGLHLVISSVELLPAWIKPFVPAASARGIFLLLLLLSLPFGVWDAFSSSVGLLRVAGWPIGDFWNLAATLGGMVVAFVPERVLALLCVLLWRVYKSKGAVSV